MTAMPTPHPLLPAVIEALQADHPAEHRVPHCPTCGKPGRRAACWACGAPLPVTRGRPRIVCRDPECKALRDKFLRLGALPLEALQ